MNENEYHLDIAIHILMIDMVSVTWIITLVCKRNKHHVAIHILMIDVC
jgi:hypothetical protein